MSHFDFKIHCLICGKIADIELEVMQPLKDGSFIHLATTMHIKQSIVCLAEERNDDWGNVVLQRLGSVIDLVAAEGLYHRGCYVLYQKTSKKVDIVEGERVRCSRPNDDAMSEAFEKLCEYLEQNENRTELLCRIYITVTRLRMNVW